MVSHSQQKEGAEGRKKQEDVKLKREQTPGKKRTLGALRAGAGEGAPKSKERGRKSEEDISVMSWNVDGGWDEVTREEVWGKSGMRTGAGGVCFLQDIRMDRAALEAQWAGWWRDRGDDAEESIHLNYAYTEGLTGTQGDEETRKLMGGTHTRNGVGVGRSEVACCWP